MINIVSRIANRRANLCAERGDRAGTLKWLEYVTDDATAAAILVKLGDYAVACSRFERAGKHADAAEAAIKANDPQRAARIVAASGDTERAAGILAQAGLVDSAADLFVSVNKIREAADLLASAGRHGKAAQLHLQCGNFDRAVELYRESSNPGGLLAAYKARGDLPAAALECRERGENGVAAALFEAAGQFADAAALQVSMGNNQQAANLFEKAGEYSCAGDLFVKMGKLDEAVRCYEQAPERAVAAADLYRRMILLVEKQRRELEYTVYCGAVARDADFLVLGTSSRSIIYAGIDFRPIWHFKVSGGGEPRVCAITDDGTTIAIAAQSIEQTDENSLLLIDSEKRLLWENETTEPVKALRFSPDGELLYAAVGDELVCYKRDGSQAFARNVDFKAWCLAVAKDEVTVGTLGGGVYTFNSKGMPGRETRLPERVHSLFWFDTVRLVAGFGEDNLAILDAGLKLLHQSHQPHPVRFVEQFPGHNVLVVTGQDQVSVADNEGETLSNLTCGDAVTACIPDPRTQVVHLALPHTLVTFETSDCRRKAAESYMRGERVSEAAEIFQEIEDYKTAYSLFAQIGDFEKAAETVHLAGDIMTAARHYELVGMFEKAAELYQQAGDRHKTATCLGKAGRYIEAADLFAELGDLIVAADFYERGEDFKKAGALFRRANQHDRAISNFESYLKSSPGDRSAMFELGNLYARNSLFDDAIRMLQQVSEVPEYRINALKTLGECFMNSRLYDVALDLLHDALGPNPKAGHDNIDIFYNIALTCEKAGRLPEAKENYAKVLAIDLNYRDARNRLLTSEEMSASAARVHSAAPLSGTDLTLISSLEPSQLEQRYKIIRKIGQGGMGVVYLALDQKLNRQIAWKVLPSHLAADPEARQRMVREAQTVAQFSHPNIIAVYDIVADDSESYITMEFVEGVTLRDRIREMKQLPLDIAVHYAIQIAGALEAAHRHGVVHRDIKPENIMLKSEDDQVKVLDFGLAQLSDDVRITRQGMILGTMSYMAPEQVQGREMDARTDIYSLGIVIFEMLAGRVPFSGTNVLAQHLHEEPPPIEQFRPDTPPEVSLLIGQCLAKPPDERPRSCAEIVSRLSEVAPPATSGTSLTSIINVDPAT